MARAGRKSKSGKREPNGRASRKNSARGAVVFDQGSDYTRTKRSVYGTDGSDAIGRAYVMGLLGEHGVALRDMARAMHRAYWPMLGVGQISSSLGEKTSSNNVAEVFDPEVNDRKVSREAWLTATLVRIDRMGRHIRRAFDQLCIDINPDCGPDWLDRLVMVAVPGDEKATRAAALTCDLAQLDAAVRALTVISAHHLRATGIQGGNNGESTLDHWFPENVA